MKELKLTQDKVCLVDDDVYDELAAHKWCLSNGYAVRRRRTERGANHEYIHKRIMGAGAGDLIIHKDGNRLNCQRENLIKTTRKVCQQRMASRTGSGYKGVTTQRGKYTAHIGVNGKTKHLGRFVTADDAARAYDKAALEIYGEHAKLNFAATA